MEDQWADDILGSLDHTTTDFDATAHEDSHAHVYTNEHTTNEHTTNEHTNEEHTNDQHSYFATESGHDPHHATWDDQHDPSHTDHDLSHSDHEWQTPLSEWHWGVGDSHLGENFGAHHSDPAAVHGDPTTDMQHWHQQAHPDTCAIVSQEFALDSMGIHMSEEQLREEAIEHGLYTPGGGTPLYAMGDLLELHGVHVDKVTGASLNDLQSALDRQEKVIVAVNGEEIWDPSSSTLHDPFGFGGHSANHAIEVIGVDRTDPTHPMVVLNDPGTPNGQGTLVPAEQFMQAWHESNNYMVHTDAAPAAERAPADTTSIWNYTPSLGGYYNGDGTYHYTSDNTDRDAQTGAVIRRY